MMLALAREAGRNSMIKIIYCDDDYTLFMKKQGLHLSNTKKASTISIMKLIIHKETRVEDIQRSFNSYYPFLRINFYAAHYPQNSLSNVLPLSGRFPDLLFRETPHLILDIHCKRTITDIEKDCADMGIQALISRKGGSVWVEILLTRDWSLDQQNRAGAALCGGVTGMEEDA